MSTTPRNDAGWLSRPDCARVFDLSLAAFDKTVRPLALPEHIRREGRILFLYARGLIDSWAAKHATSPEIVSSRERFEAARAGMAELRLARERGTVIDLQEHQAALVERCQRYVGSLESASTDLPALLADVPRIRQPELVTLWQETTRFRLFGDQDSANRTETQMRELAASLRKPTAPPLEGAPHEQAHDAKGRI